MATKTDTTTKTSNINRCACGCKNPTARTFAPGHDAKLKGAVLKIVRGEAALRTVPKSALEFAIGWPALGSNRRALKKMMGV